MADDVTTTLTNMIPTVVAVGVVDRASRIGRSRGTAAKSTVRRKRKMATKNVIKTVTVKGISKAKKIKAKKERDGFQAEIQKVPAHYLVHYALPPKHSKNDWKRW